VIEEGSLVIAYLQNPKERVWGLLLRLDAVGVVVRGLDLNSVEDWIGQEHNDGPKLITPSTQFVPMHRLERLYADEKSGTVEGYGERYSTLCGRDVKTVLQGEASS
jgi:hypothetical protein